MALTPGRWLRLLLLLLGGVFVALAPPGRDGNVLLGIFQQFTGWSSSDRFFGAAGANRDPERTQLSRVERVLHRAERRLLTMQRAQEAAGYVSRVRRDTGVVRTLFEGAVSPGIHSVAERLSQEVRRNLAVTGTVGATVMLVVRPGKGRTDAPDLWSAFTAAPAPGGCVVVITLDTLNRFPSYGWTDSRVSYCTYLAAFGPPGEGMRGLLNARQWDLVSGGAFTGPTRHAPAGHLDLQWWRSLVTAWTGDEWWRGRHPSEVGCQLGRPDACLRALRIDGQRASLWWGGTMPRTGATRTGPFRSGASTPNCSRTSSASSAQARSGAGGRMTGRPRWVSRRPPAAPWASGSRATCPASWAGR